MQIVKLCTPSAKVFIQNGEFVKKRIERCAFCNGSGKLRCEKCKGMGSFLRGGYQNKNPVNAETLLYSKWTAMEETFGWRHFQVIEKRKKGDQIFALMAATCDESTRFWINVQILKDRVQWTCGWLQKKDFIAREPKRTKCRTCGAQGWTPCTCCLEN